MSIIYALLTNSDGLREGNFCFRLTSGAVNTIFGLYYGQTLNIYYSTEAFRDRYTLFQVMGHEYNHAGHIFTLSDKFVSAFSEYSSYYWNDRIARGTGDWEEYALGYFNPEQSPLYYRYYENIVKPNYMTWEEFGLPISLPW